MLLHDVGHQPAAPLIGVARSSNPSTDVRSILGLHIPSSLYWVLRPWREEPHPAFLVLVDQSLSRHHGEKRAGDVPLVPLVARIDAQGTADVDIP